MYLSKPILFIILVVVLFVGGSSDLVLVEGVTNLQTRDKGDGCRPGCVQATGIYGNGNCGWFPADVPKSQQRYICPHTCPKPGIAGSGKCEYDGDCSKCTPQKDYTASAYANTHVTNGTGSACVKGAQCALPAKGLNMCNTTDFKTNPKNGANNLICTRKSSTEIAKWTEIDTAVSAIPYTLSQTALLTCDVDRACSTEGDSCVDATGSRIFCHNNLWLHDPKYERTNLSGDITGTGSTYHGSYAHGPGYRGKYGDGKYNKQHHDNHNDNHNNSGIITDKYYTVNHFYGPSKRENNGLIKGAVKGVAHATGHVASGISSGIKSTYDNIKNAFAPPLPKQMNYGAGIGGRNAPSIGNTVVPSIVPKGEVATVQSYEASIRF
jgi:hypothetical protein